MITAHESTPLERTQIAEACRKNSVIFACFAAAFLGLGLFDVFRHNWAISAFDYSQFVLSSGWIFCSCILFTRGRVRVGQT